MGNKQLIAEKIAKTDDDTLLYEEFKQYIANKKMQAGETSSSGSYSQRGISPLREKEFTIPESKVSLKYNYWDYIDAFHKAFLYENPTKKHTWLIKVCGNVYNSPLPNWFIQWWTIYGTSGKILPEKFKTLYGEWINISPKISDFISLDQYSEEIASMFFFIEFSIPWVWKWTPEVGYTQQNIPCLRRATHSRFWDRLIKVDPDTKEIHGKNILDEIQQKIELYKRMKDTGEVKTHSPFHQLTTMLKLPKDVIPKEDLIKSYMEELKKELIKNLLPEDKTDISMTGSSNEDCLAGESQDPDMDEFAEDNIDHMVPEIEDAARKAIK
ncbi:hypothetical protein M9H77_17544 [Catharanthus roseus]|uniref:Uncharacterized protein n=1 Tax=Catharanthus roseus TaxID=4058 RepID=A0ACC0B4Y0_CATRO|nr:hypothetical protein M9H77_17544 [Catharanthus roseus]